MSRNQPNVTGDRPLGAAGESRAAPIDGRVLRLSWSATLAASSVVFLVAFLFRISNLSVAFANGVPQFSPFDDLYHAKRIAYSATHPFRVLTFDPNQGPSASFCPWPPLYDLSAGTIARLLGGAAPIGALSAAAWFPPVAASLFAALVAAVAVRRIGTAAGTIAGLGVATAVFFLDNSRLCAIDHHFLEPPLVFGILAATIALASAASDREAVRIGGVLGLVLVAALLVQPALLTAAAIALLAILFLEPSNVFARISGVVGFLTASGILFVYGSIQPAGYPENEWYVGKPHAAALAAAAAACAVQLRLLRTSRARRPLVLPLLAGGLVYAAVPHALESLVAGSRFFGGDPWLRYLTEFQPLFFRPGSAWWGELCLIGGGVFLLAPMALTRRFRAGTRRTLLLFAAAYSLAALSSVRFLTVAAPLLAAAGAIVFSDLRANGRRRTAAAVAALVLLPGLFLSVGRALAPSRPIPEEAKPMVRAVEELPSPRMPSERVLAPWHWGHYLNVVGGRSVLLSSFGPVGGRVQFENALGMLFATREDFFADFCRDSGVRYVLLRDPRPSLGAYAEISGFPRHAFEAAWIDSEKASAPTQLMRSTFWWRAYFQGGRTLAASAERAAAFHRFRLVRVTEPIGSDSRSRVQIWELPETN